MTATKTRSMRPAFLWGLPGYLVHGNGAVCRALRHHRQAGDNQDRYSQVRSLRCWHVRTVLPRHTVHASCGGHQGVDTVQTWQARRTNPDDASMTHRQGRFVPKPFISVPGGKLSQALIQLFFNVISDAPPYEPATQEVIRTVLNAFLQEDTEEFWDIWLQGLPMDNQISDEFMPQSSQNSSSISTKPLTSCAP